MNIIPGIESLFNLLAEEVNPVEHLSQLDILRGVAMGGMILHQYRHARFFLLGLGTALLFGMSGYKPLLKIKSSVGAGLLQAGSALKLI